MPDVYEGDSPYIFVNYAHADRAAMPIIWALADAGYRVWYDDGIQVAEEFPEYIANRIHDCSCFVMFVSRASLESGWCRREVYYALRCGKTIVPIYLEDVELTRGLSMSIGTMHALFWHKLDSDTFYGRLFNTPALVRCLNERGKAQRGVQPRDDAWPRADVVSGVQLKDGIADYSWAKLKELSQMIAEAESDAEGLDIARKYYLVDKDGRLRGDTKEVVLGYWGKTVAHVRILGFRHDELAGGGKAGISFEFADVPTEHRMNPTGANKGGWEGSEMRSWLNSDFLALLPDDLREGVAEARKRTNNRGYVRRENDASVVTETADRLWLLSMSEVYGKLSAQGENVPPSPATYDAEGTQYKLYADKGVTTKNYGFCKKRGARSWWWLRSPDALDSFRFHFVLVDGDWIANCANLDSGVSPGFCF